MTERDVLEVSVHIAAHPETVFPYFTDPSRYTQWMGNQATLVPIPGGTYRVSMRDGVEVSGAFVEVDPPHRLVFTWGGAMVMPSRLAAPGLWSRSKRSKGARALFCATTTCRTKSKAFSTAQGGRCTSDAFASAWGVAIPARTRTGSQRPLG